MWYSLPSGKISFQGLKENLPKCRLCADLYGIASPRPYFWGNDKVKIFQISQSPSYKVHLTGKPFNDESGKKLREWYGVDEQEFYNKDLFYMSSVSHCYPGKTAKGANRKPARFCADIWLKREMELVETQIYIIIGAIATAYFFREGFDSLVFRDDLRLNDKPVYVLPHPSPLNRFWLERNPEFETERVPQIRAMIRNLLNAG